MAGDRGPNEGTGLFSGGQEGRGRRDNEGPGIRGPNEGQEGRGRGSRAVQQGSGGPGSKRGYRAVQRGSGGPGSKRGYRAVQRGSGGPGSKRGYRAVQRGSGGPGSEGRGGLEGRDCRGPELFSGGRRGKEGRGRRAGFQTRVQGCSVGVRRAGVAGPWSKRGSRAVQWGSGVQTRVGGPGSGVQTRVQGSRAVQWGGGGQEGRGRRPFWPPLNSPGPQNIHTWR